MNHIMTQIEGYGPLISFLHTLPEWFILLSLTFCIGTLLCRFLLLRASSETGSAHQGDLLLSTWRLFGISLCVLFASSVLYLLVRAAEMTGMPITDVFAVLPTVILRTHIGQVWLIRISALALLAVLFILGNRHRDSGRFILAIFGASLIVVMTESASGHASDKGDFSLAELMDMLHLLAASLWGGGLLILSATILPSLSKQGEGVAALNASFAQKFSAIAGVAVGVVAATALYNAWVYGGSVGAFLKTPYGWTAIAKLTLFLLIIYLGAFNRYVSVPLLQECACYYSKPQGMIERVAARFFPRYLCTREKSVFFSRFILSVKIEAILMISILLCAALLRHEAPAKHYLHLQHGAGHEMHDHGGPSGPQP